MWTKTQHAAGPILVPDWRRDYAPAVGIDSTIFWTSTKWATIDEPDQLLNTLNSKITATTKPFWKSRKSSFLAITCCELWLKQTAVVYKDLNFAKSVGKRVFSRRLDSLGWCHFKTRPRWSSGWRRWVYLRSLRRDQVWWFDDVTVLAGIRQTVLPLWGDWFPWANYNWSGRPAALWRLLLNHWDAYGYKHCDGANERTVLHGWSHGEQLTCEGAFQERREFDLL
jgi:hypothetical protein